MKWTLALPLKKLEGIVIDLDEGFREKEARGAVTQMQKWRGGVLRKWRKTFRGGRDIIDSVAIWDPFSGHLDYVSCHEIDFARLQETHGGQGPEFHIYH